MAHLDRRNFLYGLGASAAGSGLTGCLGGSGGEIDSITVAYVPIYPNVQHYVMQEEGYYAELPVEVAVERFDSGPAVVKAFASGAVDVALFGVTPAMVLVDRGTDAAVLTANSRNGFRIVATTEVVDLYEREGAAAFERFEETTGRGMRFGVPPDGSVPDVLLRYWLERDLGVGKLERVVERSTVPPAKAPRAIGSGDVDATIVQEPFATAVVREEAFAELRWSGDVLEGHPVTVLFANRRVVDAGDLVRSLVEAHVRATEFANGSPAAAAAASVIGAGVSVELAEAAMESRAADFLSDPHAITEGAATVGELVAEAGNVERPVPTGELFDFEPYDAVRS